jgi:peptidyl-prolyl cis-trans isomerase SurA
MNSRFVWLALLAATGLSSAQEPTPAPAPPAAPVQPPVPGGAFEVNAIAAVVNGRTITKSKLGFLLARDYAMLAAQFPRRGAEFERQVLETRNKILQELIDREIILSEFKELEKKGASLPEKAIDREINRQIREAYNGSEELFQEELKRARMSREAYRKMTKDQLIVEAMRAEKISEAPPPLPGEIQKEYNEIKDTIRDISKDKITFHKIFLPRQDAENPLATAESQLALAEQLVVEINTGGADIAELAKKHSRDAFASEGGFQKDLPRTDLAPEFAAILFKHKPGEVVGPLEDPAGFTIVKIVGISPGPAPSLNEVKEQIDGRVRRKKSAVAYEKWIQDKRKTAVIVKKI